MHDMTFFSDHPNRKSNYYFFIIQRKLFLILAWNQIAECDSEPTSPTDEEHGKLFTFETNTL